MRVSRSVFLFLFSMTLTSFITIFAVVKVYAQTQNPTLTSHQLGQAEIEKIITAFTAKEAEFRRKLNGYSFQRDAKLQKCPCAPEEKDNSEADNGRYHRVSKFSFDDSAKRYEKITYFPVPTGGMNLIVTPEDLEDLGGVNPFALEPSKISEYNFIYIGKERIDELDLYVFDVAPKVMPNPKKTKERYFIGRVWVEDQDFQIVKTRGKGIPETKTNKFPVVETIREHIDGKYWFPVLSWAEETLQFDNGNTLPLRMKIVYSEYKEYKGKVKIIEIDP